MVRVESSRVFDFASRFTFIRKLAAVILLVDALEKSRLNAVILFTRDGFMLALRFSSVPTFVYIRNVI